jgi:carbohydrate-binding DOMON domain-containing protein
MTDSQLSLHRKLITNNVLQLHEWYVIWAVKRDTLVEIWNLSSGFFKNMIRLGQFLT